MLPKREILTCLLELILLQIWVGYMYINVNSYNKRGMDSGPTPDWLSALQLGPLRTEVSITCSSPAIFAAGLPRHPYPTVC